MFNTKNMFAQILLLAILHILCFGQKSEKQWEDTANLLKEGLNTTVNPCDNFIEFACGAWFKTYKMDNERNAYAERYYNDLTTAILNDNELSAREKQFYKQNVFKYFSLCQQEANRTSSSYESKKNVLMSILQLQPQEAIKSSATHWISYLMQMQSNWPTVNIFFKCRPSYTKIDDDLVAVFEFSAVSFKKHPIMTNDFIVFLKRANVELKGFHNRENLTHIIENVVDFEKRLIKFKNDEYIDWSLEEKMDISHYLKKYKSLSFLTKETSTKIDENTTGKERIEQQGLSVNCSSLESICTLNNLKSCNKEFEIYSKSVLSVKEEDVKYFSFDSTYQVIYFKKLFRYLNESDHETVSAYIFFKTLKSMIEIAKIDENNTCLKHVMEAYAPALLKIYFDFYGYDSTEWKNNINLMWESITAANKLFIQGSDWISDNEKLLLIKKTDNLQFYPGIPSWIDDDIEVNSKTVNIENEYTWQEANFKQKQLNFKTNVQYVLDELPKNLLFDQNINFIPNARNTGSEIIINMGFLFPPWYHPQSPLAINYAVNGYTLGHELMHGFDSNSIHRIKEKLSNETLKKFKENQNCLQRQYENYCYPNNCVNGQLTINENIADVEGLKLSYMAYKTLQSTKTLESPLKNLHNYTWDQIFFIAFARSQCTTIEHDDNFLNRNDVHSPVRSRIDLPLKNFPLFAKAFQCPIGSFYASTTKQCEIWGSYNMLKK